jgi:hypothetical protein
MPLLYIDQKDNDVSLIDGNFSLLLEFELERGWSDISIPPVSIKSKLLPEPFTVSINPVTRDARRIFNNRDTFTSNSVK